MSNNDYFNTYGTQPDYKDVETLKKFLSPRGKILPRDKSGLTAKNQRKVAEQVKLARLMAMLPYTSYQREKLSPSAKMA